MARLPPAPFVFITGAYGERLPILPTFFVFLTITWRHAVACVYRHTVFHFTNTP